MSYIVIDDFKLGMDRRKERIAGTAGALWEGINGHINRGGSFERRKKFVKRYALPASTTFGLTQINKQLFVFGSMTSPGTIPAGITYQQLAHPGVSATGQLTVTGGTASAGVNKLSTLTINSVDVLGAAVDWVTSNTATATAIAAQINSFVSTPEYTAISSGPIVTIFAAPGASPNGFAIAKTVGGNLTCTVSATMTGGVNATTPLMTGILDVTTFGGKIYAVAQFDSGDIFHYYDGARVSSWDSVARAIAGNSSIAAALASKLSLDPRYRVSSAGAVVTIIAGVAGTAFTDTQSVVQAITNDQTITLSTIQANVSAVAETPAIFTITVQGGTPSNNGDPLQNAMRTLHDTNGLALINAGVPWAVSNAFTAQAIANAINAQFSALALVGTVGYTASFASNVVTVSAPAGAGTANNGLHMQSRTTGNFNWDSATVIGIMGTGSAEVDCGAQSGAVNAIAAVAQVVTATVGGTYQDFAGYALVIDGATYKTTGLASGMGITCFSYNQRVWSVTTSLLEFCALADPTTWTGGTSGFINMQNQNADNEPLVGIQQYQNRIAIFTRNNIQIWILAVDPSQNTFQQSVQNTGALSNRSITQYGNIDVFYLDTSGERSIRARDASNAPAVNDVGVAIDAFIQSFTSTLTGTQIGRACSVIEPIDGRYWLAIHNRIFAYSFFPGSKISAWTYYDLTDEISTADISEMVRSGNRVYLRAADNIYLYGGDTNAVYPNDNEILATVSLPFLSASKPDTIKEIGSFDIGCTGEWKVSLLPLPENETVELIIGTFNQPTYSTNKVPIQMPTPLFAMKMVCSKSGPATFSNMAVGFNFQD